MDRKLCLNKKNKKLYKILHHAMDTITGLTMVVYHYIEDNSFIMTMELSEFNSQFVRLNRKF